MMDKKPERPPRPNISMSELGSFHLQLDATFSIYKGDRSGVITVLKMRRSFVRWLTSEWRYHEWAQQLLRTGPSLFDTSWSSWRPSPKRKPLHAYIHCWCHFLPLNMRQQGRGLKMSFNSQIGNAVLGGVGFDSRPNYKLSWSFAYKLQLNSRTPPCKPEYRLHLFAVVLPSNLMLCNVCG